MATFVVLASGGDDAAEYANRIVGWRTPPSDDAADAESSLYRTAGVGHLPCIEVPERVSALIAAFTEETAFA